MGRTPDLVATMGNLQIGAARHVTASYFQPTNGEEIAFYLLASRQNHLQEAFWGLLIHIDPLR